MFVDITFTGCQLPTFTRSPPAASIIQDYVIGGPPVTSTSIPALSLDQSDCDVTNYSATITSANGGLASAITHTPTPGSTSTTPIDSFSFVHKDFTQIEKTFEIKVIAESGGSTTTYTITRKVKIDIPYLCSLCSILPPR